MDSTNSLFSNSSNSTSSSFAILTSKAISGCDELVHHLETVDGFMPNSVASHLLVFCFSATTTYILFILSIIT